MRFVAVVDRLHEVDADEVGEDRDAHVGQLLGGALDVERGPDADARLVHQLQPLPGEVLLGDVVAGDTHPDRRPGVVGQRGDRRRPGVGPVLVGGPQEGLHVLAAAVGEHLAQMLLQLLALAAAHDLGHVEPPEVLLGHPHGFGHHVVDTAQSQPVVEDRHGARRLDHDRRRQRILPPQRAGIVQRTQNQPAAAAVAVLRVSAVGEHPRDHRPAVVVTQRERAAPVEAARRGRQERAPGASSSSAGRPTTSAAGQPSRRLAPSFHSTTVPSPSMAARAVAAPSRAYAGVSPCVTLRLLIVASSISPDRTGLRVKTSLCVPTGKRTGNRTPADFVAPVFAE